MYSGRLILCFRSGKVQPESNDNNGAGTPSTPTQIPPSQQSSQVPPPSSHAQGKDKDPTSSLPLPQSQLAVFADSDCLVDTQSAAVRWAKVMAKRKRDREEERAQDRMKKEKGHKKKSMSEGEEDVEANITEREEPNIPQSDGPETNGDNDDDGGVVWRDYALRASSEEIEDSTVESEFQGIAAAEGLRFEDNPPEAGESLTPIIAQNKY
jgi:hypothetical protein